MASKYKQAQRAEFHKQSARQMLPRSTWQTQVRGGMNDEYEVYRAQALILGWKVKSFEEWLRS